MAKTILESLLDMLPDGERDSLRAKIVANPELVGRDLEDFNLHQAFNGESVVESTSLFGTGGTGSNGSQSSAGVPVTTHTTTAPAAATFSTPTAAPSASSSEISAILAKLNEMNTSLASSIDSKLAEFGKNVVTMDKLPAYRAEWMAASIKTADNYARIRESHRREFNEDLDTDAFEKFVNEQSAAGIRYLDDAPDTPNRRTGFQKAHDAYVQDRRVERRIAEGVAERAKAIKSAASVPGQSQTTSTTAAMRVLEQARAGRPGADKSNAMAAAERLRQQVASREGVGAVS